MFDYSEIRPYLNSEVNEIATALAKQPDYQRAIQQFLPDFTPDVIQKLAAKTHSLRDFQDFYSQHFVKAIIDSTISELTISGLQKLKPTEKYLFISNHRDIVTDSMLLNYLLFINGLDTTQIAIGNNLHFHPTVTKAMRLNKTFTVHRNVSPRELLQHSIRLSHYIRENITEKKDSIWIAQRQGRSKEGNDLTQPSLLKMFNMSGKGEIAANFKALNLIPISISYEYDPTALMKAELFYERETNEAYQKKPEDDFKHIVAGLKGYKGKVHIHFGEPLKKAIEEIQTIPNKNRKFKHLAKAIDEKIHGNYKIWDTNIIANNWLKGEQISEEEKAYLIDKHPILEGNAASDKRTQYLVDFILNSYANPVRNKES